MISNTELLIIQNLVEELDALYQIIIQPDNDIQIRSLAMNGKIRLLPFNKVMVRETDMAKIREAIKYGLLVLHANNREMECAVDYAS